MDNAIILHGMTSKKHYYDISKSDSPSNSHWIPWLQRQLCSRDILTQTPELPRPYAPHYQDWKAVFEKLEVNQNTLLVGHSCGGGFLVRWLSENSEVRVAKLVLVAPFLDVEKKISPMFDFDIRADIHNQTHQGVDVLHSTDDMQEIQSTFSFLNSNLDGVNYHKFSDYGHFMYSDMNTREFPELLNICLG